MNKRICFFILLLLGFVSSPKAETAAQIIATARVYLGDQSNSPTRQQFTDATLLSFLNDGQRESNSINWLLNSTYTFTLVAGTTFYTLPADFMATQRVVFKNRKMDQTSFNQLDADQPGWIGVSTGTPNLYYLNYFTTPVTIGFFPVPNTTNALPVQIYYVQQPVELTATTQIPWNGWNLLTPYHSGLAYYIAERGYMAQEDMDAVAAYQTEWFLFLQTMRQGLFKQPDFNPGVAGLRK